MLGGYATGIHWALQPSNPPLTVASHEHHHAKLLLIASPNVLHEHVISFIATQEPTRGDYILL